MHRVLNALVVVAYCGGAPLRAADWVSADGAVTVEVPDPGRFAEGRPEPPMQKLWERTDGAVRLAIIRFPLPAGMPAPPPGPQLLNDLATGWMSEMSKLPGQAQLINSSVAQHGEAAIFMMTATVTDGDHVLSSTQWVLYSGTVAWKLMAVGAGVDTQSDPDVQRFLHSLRPKVVPVQQRSVPVGSALRFAALFWGGMLVIGIVAVLVAKFAAGVPFARSSAALVLLLSALSLVGAIRIAPQAPNGSVLVGQFLPTLLTAILGLWLWNRPGRNVRRGSVPRAGQPIDESLDWFPDQDEEQP